jgi:hypothetical protein
MLRVLRLSAYPKGTLRHTFPSVVLQQPRNNRETFRTRQTGPRCRLRDLLDLLRIGEDPAGTNRDDDALLAGAVPVLARVLLRHSVDERLGRLGLFVDLGLATQL